MITLEINCWFGIVVKCLPADWKVAGSRPGHVRFFQSQNVTVYGQKLLIVVTQGKQQQAKKALPRTVCLPPLLLSTTIVCATLYKA